MATYEFQFDPRFARYLSVLGVRPDTASVTVEDGRLVARFGPWVCETTTGNVVGTELSGPYSPLKAIGPRVSYKDRGLTFGSNAARGVCIKFREPVHGIEPTG